MTRIFFLHTDLTDLTDFCSRRCAHTCTRDVCTRDFFEHELREWHEYFFCTRISLISRIFVRGGALTCGTWDACTRISLYIFLHTRFALGPLRREVIERIERIFNKTLRQQNYSCYSDYSCSKKTQICGYWLVVWLLTRCVVIDSLWFKWQIKKDIREPCEALADPWDLWDPCA